MNNGTLLYADVVLPLAGQGCYTYAIPEEFVGRVERGCRVIVQFGARKYYTAIVWRVHGEVPHGDFLVKSISDVLDPYPVLFTAQYDFWDWISKYYLCSLGEVYKAALPAGMKLESETQVEVNDDFVAEVPLTSREQQVFDLLRPGKPRRLGDLEKETGGKNLLPVVRALLEKEAVMVKEEVKRVYRPKTETCVRLASPDCSDEELGRLVDSLRRTSKRQSLLMEYLRLVEEKRGERVGKLELLKASGSSLAVLGALVDKGILELYQYEIGRLGVENGASLTELKPLSQKQQEAFDDVCRQFAVKNVCLLHGVTSSGKTEIYIHLIKQALERGGQVLYMLPEIALTTQITERLKRVFGDELGVCHSKCPDAERVEIWQKQLSDSPYSIILGVRSSVFLPFRRLDLVIVDEEHENSYKQQDPAPRYHARNAAIMLASMYGAKTLLGTATPSVESYFNAKSGKYGLVELLERYHSVCLPDVQVVDIGELARKRQMKGPFSPLLLEKINEALAADEQIILFQNRRGFAPMIECKTCGWVPRCKNCDVSLTYHKRLGLLTCHYCGYTYHLPQICPACEGKELMGRGFGTERIEDNIEEIFPGARIVRMDLDTARTRTAYERIIHDFQQRHTDILIGTQMVSKGLDFDNVSVVGILNADSLMNFPDFRAHERAFQLMAQVAGRAGRGGKQGVVVLQTKSKDASVIRQVVQGDYAGLYADQLAERKMFRYPPYYRLVYIYLKHRKSDSLDLLADVMQERLRRVFGDRVLGPDVPPVSRIQTYYIRKIVLKVETSASLLKVYGYLQTIRQELLADERFRSFVVYFDVDPY